MNLSMRSQYHFEAVHVEAYLCSYGFAVVPLFESIIFSPNVLPLSLLTFMTGSSLLSVRSHQLTYTLFPDAAIDASLDTTPFELLRSSFGLNVFPLSAEALKSTSQSPVLLDHHAS